MTNEIVAIIYLLKMLEKNNGSLNEYVKTF